MVVLPSEYSGDRFFATPLLEDGERLRLFVDTAGSFFIFQDVAEEHGFRIFEIGEEEGEPMLAARVPAFQGDGGIPTPPGWKGPIVPLRPAETRRKLTAIVDEPIHGVLGQQCFGGRIWTFDYPERELRYHTPEEWPREVPGDIELGFRHNETGQRLFNFPRLVAEIDGKPYSLLLDTGASCRLSDTAFQQLGDRITRKRATSFMARSRFDKLREQNPDWRYIEEGDVGLERPQPMLKVPEISVEGHCAGPVWLARRPDDNFLNYMSQWTDRPVEGALGGDFLREFKAIVDYPAARLTLED